MRLIDADEFRYRLYEEAYEKDSEDQRWDSGCWIRYRLFEKILEEQPTIEPEQTKGLWLQVTVGEPSKYMCSCCGRTVDHDGINGLVAVRCPYCHCGAKMALETVEENEVKHKDERIK